MILFTVPGEPVPFARAGANGKARFTPRKQADFMTAVRTFAARAMEGRPPMDGPVGLTILATYLVPPSWSGRKRANAYWKATRPDAGNLQKLLEDAMNKIVFVDDAQVASVIVRKIYGSVAGVEVRVEPLVYERGRAA